MSPPLLEELRGRADIEILEGELTAFDDAVRLFPSLFSFLIFSLLHNRLVFLCCGLIYQDRLRTRTEKARLLVRIQGELLPFGGGGGH